MKQKFLFSFFSFLFFSFFIFLSAHSAKADGLFIIGDSIAQGLTSQGGLNPAGNRARQGAPSSEIAGYSVSGGNYTQVVISAGSNDPTSSNLAANLRTIRAKFPNARVVWVLPYNRTAASTVRSVMNSGDTAVDLRDFPEQANNPGHPQSYANVGTAIRQQLGSGGSTATNPGTGGSAQNVAQRETPTQNASSGLIPCGRKAGQGSASDPCTACHAVLAGKNLIDYLTGIMVVVAIAVIVGMGILYIMSGVNAGLKKTAKAGLTAVLVGLIFMLSAWLIVSTVLRFLASDSVVQGGGGFIGLSQGEGVYGLQCNTTSTGATVTFTPGGTVATTPYTGGAGGNGTCSPITTQGNPCSVERLRNTCFSATAETWSRMCNLESRGTPIRSQTDVCVNLGNRSFSGGLFQVNIIANGRMLDAERCNDLGRHTNCVRRNSGGACTGWSCTQGSDFANWDYCMGLTMNEQTNIRAACTLSQQGHVTTPWPHTRRVCGVPTRI